MRSLAWKLTLAFLLVGLTGAILVALLTGVRTRSEFNRFRSERDQIILVETLGNYYTVHKSWDGVGDALSNTPPLQPYSRVIVIADPQGKVIIGNRRYSSGEIIPTGILTDSIPIEVDNHTVGFVISPFPDERPDVFAVTFPATGPPISPENAFLQRVTWAAAVSAIIAALTAMLLGFLLARTLTRPLSELTLATQAMASGKLDQRVKVHSHDEIGELALSFNQMSSDLARGSTMRKQMTADLAHDLRTPLSILRGYTEGLKDGRISGTTDLYSLMHGEVEHLQRLVEDLRTLSLADAGELPLNRRAVDPAALLERAGLAYVVQAEQQGITLRVEPAEDLPSISVDTDRMAQVLNNLVSNALRYTPQGEIVLSATADASFVTLQVRDTGKGIDAKDLPFIFDRFYRADESRQRNDSMSSGLGLAIAKAIVEAHQGKISVESTPGVGTAFSIGVPSVRS